MHHFLYLFIDLFQQRPNRRSQRGQSNGISRLLNTLRLPKDILGFSNRVLYTALLMLEMEAEESVILTFCLFHLFLNLLHICFVRENEFHFGLLLFLDRPLTCIEGHGSSNDESEEVQSTEDLAHDTLEW